MRAIVLCAGLAVGCGGGKPADTRCAASTAAVRAALEQLDKVDEYHPTDCTRIGYVAGMVSGQEYGIGMASSGEDRVGLDAQSVLTRTAGELYNTLNNCTPAAMPGLRATARNLLTKARADVGRVCNTP